MLCVIPFFAGDRAQAVELSKWLKDLGGVKHHNCLFVVDEGVSPDEVYRNCAEAFKSVEVIYSQNVQSKGQWGDGTTDASGPNEMFLTAAHYIEHKLKVRWFWLESDSCPTRSTWLDEIEAEDKKGGKPFTGAYVNIPPHEPHMTGIAVYPPDVARYSLGMMMPGRIAWDYAGRKDTVEKGKAHFTDLIQHEYRIHGESPSFPTRESLSVIKPRTAVFHRCKDSTLIERLRERNAELFNSTLRSARLETLPDGYMIPGACNATFRGMPDSRILELQAEVLQLRQTIKMMQEELDKRENPANKTRVMSPEHKAKLGAALAKARAKKAEKAKAK